MINKKNMPLTFLFPGIFFLLSLCFCSSGIAGISSQSHLLEFTSARHVLAFDTDNVYIASADHAVHVTFLGTAGTAPVAEKKSGQGEESAQLHIVTYSDLWPKINLSYEQKSEGIVESIWKLNPGADLDDIRLHYNAPASIEENGDLTISYPNGMMRESSPVAWQDINKQRIPVKVSFNVVAVSDSSSTIGFALGAYNSSYPVMIDPVMEWNTFTGSSGYQEGTGISIDNSGDIYVVGYSRDSWGTPTNAFSGGYSDAFVAKFNPSGVLLWHAFIGTPELDQGTDIVVDANAVYISGKTDTGHGDAFAATLTKDGAFIWYRSIGSTDSAEQGNGIAVDSAANVYLTGNGGINGWNFNGTIPPIVPGSSWDAFVAKWNYSGDYQWHTFLGGEAGGEIGEAIAADSAGNVYVTGESGGTWGTPVSAYHSAGYYDAFVAKLNSAGILQWNTFVGNGSMNYLPFDIAIDNPATLIYITGRKNNINTSDGFLTCLNTAGVQQWDTTINNEAYDVGRSVVVGGNGDLYVTENSRVLGYNSAGTQIWALPLAELTTGIDINSEGTLVVGGYSSSSWGTPVTPHAGSSDVFAAKICLDCLLVSTSVPDGHGSLSPSSAIVSPNDTAIFSITPDTGYSTASVNGCNGTWAGGNEYETGAIVGECTVEASFSLNSYTVGATTDIHGTLDNSEKSATHGGTVSFTVTAETGYTTNTAVGGTCSAGSWNGSTYTTGPITAPCSVSFSHTVNTYAVTASVDSHGTLNSSEESVTHGGTASFTVTAETGYTTNTAVEGSCPAGSWNGSTYTTGTITAPCGIGFSHSISTYAVAASVDGHGTLNSSEESVAHGGTASFTVTAETGYTTNTAVGGTCPAGSWSGTVYTTGTITAPCNVSFSHTINIYTVTASVDSHGTLNSSTESVGHGGTTTFVVTAESGYLTNSAVGGTCPAGSWSGSSYTTGAIIATCSVSFSHAIGYTVNASVDSHGTLDVEQQNVPNGGAAAFTVTAETGYTTDTAVGGTCSAGSWSGSTYTTGTITADCEVIFTHTMTQSGFLITPYPGSESVLLDSCLHSIAVKGDGTVVAWGYNNYSQASPPENLTGVTAVAAGYWSSHALTEDGFVVSWGGDGTGSELPPADLTDVIAIADGFNHSLALKADGTVVAWGQNSSGETSVPAGLPEVVAITAGYGYSVALTKSGTIVAWGSNNYGQTTVPPDLTDVTAVSSNSAAKHTLVLKGNGTVTGFGFNNVHVLDIPANLNNVIAISAGSAHSLALKNDGTVVAWGYNSGGETDVPSDLTDVVAISAGNGFSLALKGDGTIVGWGVNNYGAIDIPEPLNLLPFHGIHGRVSPNRAVKVIAGSNMQFTLSPDPGYSASVSGTCGGTLVGNTFTTDAVSNDCSVEVDYISGDDNGCSFYVLPTQDGKAAVICL